MSCMMALPGMYKFQLCCHSLWDYRNTQDTNHRKGAQQDNPTRHIHVPQQTMWHISWQISWCTTWHTTGHITWHATWQIIWYILLHMTHLVTRHMTHHMTHLLTNHMKDHVIHLMIHAYLLSWCPDKAWWWSVTCIPDIWNRPPLNKENKMLTSI